MIDLRLKGCCKNKGVLLLVFFMFLVMPFVFGFSASTSSYSVDSYHTGISGNEPDTSSYDSRSTAVYQQGGNANGTTSSYFFNSGWFEIENITEEEDVSPPVTEDIGGGGGGGVECSRDSDCLINQYCFRNSCFDAECSDDSDCNVEEDEVCWNLRCVKLFDIKIIEFESPIVLGEFFDFTYFAKGMADINGDVIINFRIEQDGSVVSSGYDVIYFGSFDEKTETTSLFLPSDTKSGTYEFIVEVNLDKYSAQSSRTVEITVADGVAILRLFDISFSLEDTVIESSDELLGTATFENFGNVPTSVDLTFIISNEDERQVHREEQTIIVETEEILRKSFKGLSLPRGKYTVVLETLYNVDVSDKFSQEFEIVSRFKQYLYYGLIGIVILFIVIFIWLVLKRKLKVKIQITRKVSGRIKQARIASELKRSRRELQNLRKIREMEEISKQKLKEKQKITKERSEQNILGRTFRRKNDLEAQKRLMNEEVELERKKFREAKKTKTHRIDKRVGALEHKKILLEEGYKEGYIDREAYEVDMKELNRHILLLRKC